VQQIVTGISPHTGPFIDKLTGTPIYVEVNFRRFKKITLLRPKKLSRTVDDQEEALTLGKLYLRATVLEKLFTSPS
jgi:hypothetical protein